LWQQPTTSESHLYRLLRSHLRADDVLRFRVAVAYVTWGGLSLVASELEAFLRRGKVLETIFGIENGVTTPDALLYSVHLQREFSNYKLAKSYSWNYIDSEFHSKYFEFDYPGHTVSIVGSGNFTSGGLACNHELAVELGIPAGSKLHSFVRQWWSRYSSGGKRITPNVIRNMTKTGRFGVEGRTTNYTDKQKRLGLVLPKARKPLFKHILVETRDPHVGQATLADGDTLTEKPRRLYLQILENETGGGHQIQLPVATLGAFFGVGPKESKKVEFKFRSSMIL
jgi:HKD family nuclease